MNLSRAKTVLICTFLALNIFLCYQLWQDQGYGGFASFGQKEEITRLEIALQNAGLILEANLPKSTEPVAYMIVEPWTYSPQELIFNLWESLEGPEESVPEITIDFSKNADKEGEENLLAYSFGRYELVVSRTGTAVLKFAPRDEEAKQITTEQEAQQLIKSISFLDDFVPDYSHPAENGKIICFRQEYEKFPLYAGYLHYFVIKRQPILQFYRLEVLGFADQKREVISSSTALLRFLERYEKTEGEVSIVEFSMGYYTREYDAERWEIPPVWRIRLNNGELYYINAFTGNPEI